MRMSRWVAALACAAVAVAGLTAAPGWTVAAVASVAAPPARPSAQHLVPAGYEPISTSWPTPRSGLVLFGKGIAGAGLPYLFRTGDGGRSWRRVAMPRWLPDSTIASGDGAIVAVSSTPSQRSADSPAWRIGVSRDGGRRWATLGVPGVLPARHGLIVGLLDLTVADGRVFVVVTRTVYGTGASSAGVYSAGCRGRRCGRWLAYRSAAVWPTATSARKVAWCRLTWAPTSPPSVTGTASTAPVSLPRRCRARRACRPSPRGRPLASRSRCARAARAMSPPGRTTSGSGSPPGPGGPSIRPGRCSSQPTSSCSPPPRHTPWPWPRPSPWR